MAVCKLCGLLVEQLPTAAPGLPIIGDPNRAAVEYQTTIGALARHMVAAHPEYVELLAQTAQTYHLHLIAKLAISTDARFDDEREAARGLCYWTLTADLEFSSTSPIEN